MKISKLPGRVPVHLDAFEPLSLHPSDLIVGTPGADSLTGTDGDDDLRGRQGNDTIDAGPSGIAGDTVHGGEGNDRITIEDGFAYGGAGNDTVAGAGTLFGGSGNDRLTLQSSGRLYGNEGSDVLVGSAGSDTLVAGPGSDSLWGGAGDDVLMMGPDGFDSLNGQDGNDTLVGDGSAGDLLGGNGDDKLTGASFVLGQDGNDTVVGTDGDDWYLAGGRGTDSVRGGAGDDSFVTNDNGFEGDTLDGGTGIDDLQVHWITTEDIVWINDPTQTQFVAGTTVSSIEVMLVDSGSGDDLLDVGGGLRGEIDGGAGWDTLRGGASYDDLYGGDGNDVLIGRAGKDGLSGEAGLDTLRGGTGTDSLWGGSGADRFVCGDTSAVDYVWDFAPGVDKLAIAQSEFSVGDGDTLVEGASTIGGPGGFAASAELVVNTKAIGGVLTKEKVAAAMGSASDSYALGQTAIFVVDSTDGEDSTLVYGFESSGTDAVISADELTLLCDLWKPQGTTIGDYLFVG